MVYAYCKKTICLANNKYSKVNFNLKYSYERLSRLLIMGSKSCYSRALAMSTGVLIYRSTFGNGVMLYRSACDTGVLVVPEFCYNRGLAIDNGFLLCRSINDW